MEIGLVLALFCAVSFALSNIFIRRVTYRTGETFSAAFVTIVLGAVFFTVLVLLTGDWKKLATLSWQAYLALAVAGIIHFVLGRRLSYTCYRLIGATRGTAIIRTQIVYPVVLGIVLLGEPITIYLILGFLCVGIGATLVSLGGSSDKVLREATPRALFKGILAGLIGAFFWGISGVIIKPVVQQMGSPYAGAFVSYLTAAVIMLGFLFFGKEREQLSRIGKPLIIPVFVGGLFAALAQLLRYSALIFSPVSLVEPIQGTSTVFIIVFSFLVNRNIEVFTWKVLLGIMFATAGTVLFFQ